MPCSSRVPRSPRRATTRIWSAAGLALAASLLTACSGTSGPLVDVAGPTDGRSDLSGTEVGDVIPRPPLLLQDTEGRSFDLRQRPAGELTTVFFGYTHCPDVCPTTMADLSAARRQLSAPEQQRLRLVFVTEDPSRDTPAVLRSWLDRFGPDITGLLGGGARTRAVLTALKAPQTEIVPTPRVAAGAAHSDAASGEETVEHSGSVYAFLGERVVVYTGGTTSGQYAADFHALLAP